MKTKTRNQAVTNALYQICIKILADVPERDILQKRAEAQYAHFRAVLPAEELAPIDMAAKIMAKLAEKLVDCQDITQLELSLSYAQALLDGDVLIAEPDGLQANQ